MPQLSQGLSAPWKVSARLLVVEDDPVFRRYVLAALQEAHLVRVDAVTAASLASALEALEASAARPFDCVLLDLGLPDSVGLDTVRTVLLRAPTVPVVVLTGEEDGELSELALRAGAQDFLEKAQLEPSSLARAIRHAVDRGRWAQQVAGNNRELAARNRDLDDFAHAVSHDLKAPLRAIFHLFEEAKEQLAARDVAGAQATVLQVQPRLERLFNMIDGVLRVTTAGRLAQADHVDTAAVVREVVANLDVPAGFEVRIAEGLPAVVGGKANLAQVFQNLVDNAIKHHPGPTAVIEVSWRDAGTHYEFSVADDGRGIPPDQRQRVFELFQTIPRPDQAGGTGIGLALVRKVVLANGGTVVVEDNEPRGARFRFTWPKPAGEGTAHS